MSDNRKPVPPNPPRWQPSKDPASINIPGLDTTAPVNDQVDQIEHMITFKLQNIDENFSKIQNILSTKILPAVKRYAVGTEPVRDAAKFWTSFYEEAAQIRIPTYDDYSSMHDERSQQGTSDTSQSDTMPSRLHPSHPQHSHSYEPNITSSESSFGQTAFSSTPAPNSRHHSANNMTQDSETSSWSASLESPLVRLDREIQNFTRDDETRPLESSVAPPPSLDDTQEQSTRRQVEKGKSKAREPDASLLRNVLLQTLRAANDKPTTTTRHVSPLKLKPKLKTPIPKALNPYLPPNTNPADWSGIVDLRDSSLATPRRHKESHAQKHSSRRTPKSDDMDDSFDGLPPGMSPPRMMSPAAPPRSSAELGLLKLSKTPLKDAAERIRQDLINEQTSVRSGTGLFGRGQGYGRGGDNGTESSMSTVPTPPSLSRYTSRYGLESSGSTLDPSLESMLRRVGLDAPSDSMQFVAATQASLDVDVSLITPLPPDNDSDSDSDSLDEIHNTAHPSAAFLLASQGQRRSSDDDSFGSSNRSSDSLNSDDLDGNGMAPIHPFARRGDDQHDDFDDDSFDNDGYERNTGPEETLFGLPPQARMQREQELRLLGEGLLEDTLGIGAQIARSGRAVEESPTPWTRSEVI